MEQKYIVYGDKTKPSGEFILDKGATIKAGNYKMRLELNIGTYEQMPVYGDFVDLYIISENVDVDIDSDNDDSFIAPKRTPFEEKIEDDALKTGKIIDVNDNDDDNDFIPDYADGYNYDGSSANAKKQFDDINASDYFTPIIIEIPDDIDISRAYIKITYKSSPPLNVIKSGTTPDYEYKPATGNLRIWMKDGYEQRDGKSVKSLFPGDYIPSEKISVADLGFTENDREKTFYIEGIAPSSGIGTNVIKVEMDRDGSGPEGFILSDEIRITVIKIDLEAVDSSNDVTEEIPGTPVVLNDDWDCEKEYTVTKLTDRMGMRLEGYKIENIIDANIKSEGIIKGVIQVPADGNPIIMLSDHGTNGGYPKIGVVISADYDKLVQLPPGSKIKFQEIELADAEILFKLYQMETKNLVLKIK